MRSAARMIVPAPLLAMVSSDSGLCLQTNSLAHAVLVVDGGVDLAGRRVHPPDLAQLHRGVRRAVVGGGELTEVEEGEPRLRRLRGRRQRVLAVAGPERTADLHVVQRPETGEGERRHPGPAHPVELPVGVLEVLPVAVQHGHRVVVVPLVVEPVQHRPHLLVVGDAEGAHGDRPLHEVEVLVRGPVLQRERGVELADLQDRQIVPGRQRHEVVGGGDVRRGDRRGRCWRTEREVSGQPEVDEGSDPAAQLEARAAEQEGVVGDLRLVLVTRVVEEIGVDLQATVGEEDELVVGRAQKRVPVADSRQRL